MGEIQLTLDQWTAEYDPRSEIGDSTENAVLAPEAGEKIVHSVVPRIRWGLGLDLSQTSGETPVLGGVRGVMNNHGLDHIDGNRDGKASGDGIDILGRVEEKETFAFGLAIEIQLAFVRSNYSGIERQSVREFLLSQWQGIEQLIVESGGRLGVFR